MKIEIDLDDLPDDAYYYLLNKFLREFKVVWWKDFITLSHPEGIELDQEREFSLHDLIEAELKQFKKDNDKTDLNKMTEDMICLFNSYIDLIKSYNKGG